MEYCRTASRGAGVCAALSNRPQDPAVLGVAVTLFRSLAKANPNTQPLRSPKSSEVIILRWKTASDRAPNCLA